MSRMGEALFDAHSAKLGPAAGGIEAPRQSLLAEACSAAERAAVRAHENLGRLRSLRDRTVGCPAEKPSDTGRAEPPATTSIERLARILTVLSELSDETTAVVSQIERL